MPGEVVAMDIVGPFPLSSTGHRYVLTVMDHASAWVEAYPLPQKSGFQVLNKFNTEWISRYGAPAVLITDQGAEFNNTDFRQYLRDLGIQHRRSTPYHPQTNGKLERAHRTIKGILRKLANNRLDDWESCLAQALWAYRITPKPNGFTPYFLHLGRNPDLPETALTAEHGALNRWQYLRECFREAYENSREYDYRRLTARANGPAIRIGDSVVVYNNEQGVLDPKWDHLYTVTKVRGPVISLCDEYGRKRIVNRSQVRLAPADGWSDIGRRLRRAERRAHTESTP